VITCTASWENHTGVNHGSEVHPALQIEART
jgi:hypothetical protein